jgi:hypothetical protein
MRSVRQRSKVLLGELEIVPSSRMSEMKSVTSLILQVCAVLLLVSVFGLLASLIAGYELGRSRLAVELFFASCFGCLVSLVVSVTLQFSRGHSHVERDSRELNIRRASRIRGGVGMSLLVLGLGWSFSIPMMSRIPLRGASTLLLVPLVVFLLLGIIFVTLSIVGRIRNVGHILRDGRDGNSDEI